MTTTFGGGGPLGTLSPPHAPAAEAAEYFRARLRFQTDVSDVHAAMETGRPGFVLVDTRGRSAWAQGRIPGAVHLPTREMAARASEELSLDRPVVTYCWGPGCDGATRGALELATLGYRVKEMIGGLEYWVREGFTIQTDAGAVHPQVDPLTAPRHGVTCDC